MPTLTELSLQADALLSAHPGGHPDPKALGEIADIAAVMRTVAPAHAAEKITGVMVWAAVLYSSRKHRDYDRGSPVSGAERVRMFLRQELSTLRAIDAVAGRLVA